MPVLCRWVSLIESSLHIDATKRGDAVGFLGVNSSSTGDAAHVLLTAEVDNGQGAEHFYTNSTATWFSQTNHWASAGTIAATSVLRLVDTADWNALANFHYGQNEFSISASDTSLDGDSLFLAEGNGAFGGNSNSW